MSKSIEPVLQPYRVRGARREDTNKTFSDMMMAESEEDAVRQFNHKHPEYRVINIMSLNEAEQNANRLRAFQEKMAAKKKPTT
ncbi:MAG TPA: hypothetical protein VIY47_11755, partial [Ignavibacteriaceae bacterium]